MTSEQTIKIALICMARASITGEEAKSVAIAQTELEAEFNAIQEAKAKAAAAKVVKAKVTKS